MMVEYSIVEQVFEDQRQGNYVPVHGEIFKRGQLGFSEEEPWALFEAEHDLEYRVANGIPVYIVTYIQHTGKDDGSKYFLSEKEAKSYIKGLARAIYQRENTSKVDVHDKMGEQNLFTVLEELPINNYVSFRTPKNTYSVTFYQV